ncbi:uncharacterized protein LOC6538374 [Drosophila yakuba]|uniref:DUF243 domain-containing protein n=1 Tax=Drosophila yakuba TaxID=7245 RepID=B4PSE8_DROYA|nr:uncharacterized protein LOC6538374 [Drosophila yakuba]EDW98610.1 uncharacterized protein Dyak_GE23679 [Drosophila yakuba]
MHQFSAVLCLCLAVLARADKLGYNYQPVAHSSSGLSFTPSGSASSDAPAFAPAPSASFAAGPSSIADALEGSQSAAAPNYAAPQAQLEKEFFTYTADEGDFYDPAASDQAANAVNKGLRVVFIKGPENRGLEDAALALAKQAAQQETAIYVLNKQADIGDLANKLNAIRNNNNNKPEVHFVKYRTPEDAANAQRAIQGQYDQLGGSSQAQDGGVASTLNFASQPAPVQAASSQAPAQFLPASQPEATAPISSYVPPATPGSSYLPANILRRLRF